MSEMSSSERRRIMSQVDEFFPSPEEARRADQPETIDQLKQQVLELKLALETNRKLHNLCKRFINKHKLRSREDFAPLMDQRFLIQDICECIGYEP